MKSLPHTEGNMLCESLRRTQGEPPFETVYLEVETGEPGHREAWCRDEQIAAVGMLHWRGYVVAGIDEDGDIFYVATELGARMLREGVPGTPANEMEDVAK